MAGRRVVGVAICAVAAACATAVVTGQTVATSTAPAFTPVGHIPPDQLDDAEVVRGIDGGINFLLKDFDKYVAKIRTAPACTAMSTPRVAIRRESAEERRIGRRMSSWMAAPSAAVQATLRTTAIQRPRCRGSASS